MQNRWRRRWNVWWWGYDPILWAHTRQQGRRRYQVQDFIRSLPATLVSGLFIYYLVVHSLHPVRWGWLLAIVASMIGLSALIGFPASARTWRHNERMYDEEFGRREGSRRSG